MKIYIVLCDPPTEQSAYVYSQIFYSLEEAKEYVEDQVSGIAEDMVSTPPAIVWNASEFQNAVLECVLPDSEGDIIRIYEREVRAGS